jgi:glyoxylase-like metal-dependent hydrolase (beta-lactamase superfamily II)
MENLVTITIRSTHYYVIVTGSTRLMVDAGWAGTLPELKSQLKRFGLDLSSIDYLMITHLHPDHAGLTQEIKQAGGARLILMEKQVPFLSELKSFYEKKGERFIPIQIDPGDLILRPGNRSDLAKIGVGGEMIETPGHSDDSVSLVLDSGMAFIGDLHPPELMEDTAAEVTTQSWIRLIEAGARKFYPAHGSPFDADQV